MSNCDHTKLYSTNSVGRHYPAPCPWCALRALTTLAFMARTAGGTARHDAALRRACEDAEEVLGQPVPSCARRKPEDEPRPPINIVTIKTAVLEAAFGAKALPELEFYERLQGLYIIGAQAGAAHAAALQARVDELEQQIAAQARRVE